MYYIDTGEYNCTVKLKFSFSFCEAWNALTWADLEWASRSCKLFLEKNYILHFSDLCCFPGFYHGITLLLSLLFEELVEDTTFLFLKKTTLRMHLSRYFVDLCCRYHLLRFREEQFLILHGKCSVNPHLSHCAHNPPTENNNMWECEIVTLL